MSQNLKFQICLEKNQVFQNFIKQQKIRHWARLVWKKCPVSSVHMGMHDLAKPISWFESGGFRAKNRNLLLQKRLKSIPLRNSGYRLLCYTILPKHTFEIWIHFYARLPIEKKP